MVQICEKVENMSNIHYTRLPSKFNNKRCYLKCHNFVITKTTIYKLPKGMLLFVTKAYNHHYTYHTLFLAIFTHTHHTLLSI